MALRSVKADDPSVKYPDPLSGTKRNLTNRIAQFSPITAYERDQVSKAVDALQDGRYADGEYAMHKAENSHVYDPKVVPPNA